jgi:hypothetical protein
MSTQGSAVTSWAMRAIGKRGARSSGPMGWRVPGCSGGWRGVGRCGTTLNHAWGILSLGNVQRMGPPSTGAGERPSSNCTAGALGRADPGVARGRAGRDSNGDSMGLPILATKDVQMADIGDRVQVASTKVGQDPRDGVVTGVIGSLLRVKWSTGEESTFAPQMGSLSVIGRDRSGSKRRISPANARTGTTKAGAAKRSATKTAKSTQAAKKAEKRTVKKAVKRTPAKKAEKRTVKKAVKRAPAKKAAKRKVTKAVKRAPAKRAAARH